MAMANPHQEPAISEDAFFKLYREISCRSCLRHICLQERATRDFICSSVCVNNANANAQNSRGTTMPNLPHLMTSQEMGISPYPHLTGNQCQGSILPTINFLTQRPVSSSFANHGQNQMPQTQMGRDFHVHTYQQLRPRMEQFQNVGMNLGNHNPRPVSMTNNPVEIPYHSPYPTISIPDMEIRMVGTGSIASGHDQGSRHYQPLQQISYEEIDLHGRQQLRPQHVPSQKIGFGVSKTSLYEQCLQGRQQQRDLQVPGQRSRPRLQLSSSDQGQSTRSPQGRGHTARALEIVERRGCGRGRGRGQSSGRPSYSNGHYLLSDDEDAWNFATES